jgi:hypothetical protein
MSHNTGIFWPGNTNAKFFWLSMASVTIRHVFMG